MFWYRYQKHGYISGGSRWAPPPPPNGSQFFRFDFYFAEKRPCRRLTPASLTNREILATTVCARPVTVSSLLKTTAKCLALADPRGGRRHTPSPNRTQYFPFCNVFTEKCPRRRSPPKGNLGPASAQL